MLHRNSCFACREHKSHIGLAHATPAAAPGFSLQTIKVEVLRARELLQFLERDFVTDAAVDIHGQSMLCRLCRLGPALYSAI